MRRDQAALLLLLCLSCMQLSYFLLTRSRQLPTTIAQGSSSSTGGDGSSLHVHTSAERALVSRADGDRLHETATLYCEDVKPATGNCTHVRMQGLCYGDTLLSCVASCGMCSALRHMAEQLLQLPVQLATQQQGGSHQDTEEEEACEDRLNICPRMANVLQLCDQSGALWVRGVCQASCGLCSKGSHRGLVATALPRRALATASKPCSDRYLGCDGWAVAGQCSLNTAFMKVHCSRACGLCDNPLIDPTSKPLVFRVGKDAHGHWQYVNNSWAEVQPGADDCTDTQVACTTWAAAGECTRNSIFMAAACRLSCKLCMPRKQREARRCLREPFMGGGQEFEAAAAITAPTTLPLLSASWAVTSNDFLYEQYLLQQVMLNNGVLMPVIGFGTAGLGTGTEQAVAHAIQAGYRHLDSAQAREWYREDLVGAAIQASGVPRHQLFITTKIHPRHLGYEQTLSAFPTSLAELGTTYLDLTLLHYPSCFGDLCKGATDSSSTHDAGTQTWQQSWRALEDLYLANRTRAIGVSNFNLAEMQELYQFAHVKPQVLQVHVDPFSQNRDLLAFCRLHGIQMVAYSSLGTQWSTGGINPVLNNPQLKAMAAELHCSTAQLVLRWVLHMSVAVIPRSSNPHHMAQSLKVLNGSINLQEDQLRTILKMDGQRV